MMRAVICGEGLDGLFLALQLGRGGWDVRVLLNEARSSRCGYLVEIGGEGLAAAEDLGLLPTLLECAECLSHVRWVDSCGKPIVDLHVGDEGDGSEEPLHVLRETFEHVLLHSLPYSVQVQTRCAVEGVHVRPDGLDLALTSGERLETDLLVGADGGNSRIRELVFGHEGVWRRSLGYHTAAFVFEDPDVHYQLTGHLSVLSAPGRLLALCPLQDGHVAATFAFRTASDVRPKVPADWLKFVFRDLKWCAPAVLEHAKRSKELRYDRATQIKTSTWYRTRIGLLGDACHTYSLLPGQGCSTGIAAACWLGKALVRGASFDAAFAWYEAQLAQEILARRESAKRLASWLMPESRTELAVRNSLLRMAGLPGIGRFVKPGLTLTI
jgi:2-polyprenyl-6-methoxyphenol hydroxylase-like FAD-dependent oxidoreductase